MKIFEPVAVSGTWLSFLAEESKELSLLIDSYKALAHIGFAVQRKAIAESCVEYGAPIEHFEAGNAFVKTYTARDLSKYQLGIEQALENFKRYIQLLQQQRKVVSQMSKRYNFRDSTTPSLAQFIADPWRCVVTIDKQAVDCGWQHVESSC